MHVREGLRRVVGKLWVVVVSASYAPQFRQAPVLWAPIRYKPPRLPDHARALKPWSSVASSTIPVRLAARLQEARRSDSHAGVQKAAAWAIRGHRQ